MISRRKFSLNGLAAGVAGSAFASTAKSYAQILGANDRLNFAINGLNGRGDAHLSSLERQQQDCPRGLRLRRRLRHPGQVRGQGASRCSATRPKPRATSATFWNRKRSTPSPSPRPTTGTRPWPCSASRPASTSTSKSPPARIRAKASCSWPRRRNTARWSRWAISSALPTTPSK